MTRIIISTLLCASLLPLTACATARDSILLGAGTGAVVGAGLGASTGQSSGNEVRNGAVGAATGALFGGVIGYFAHKDQETRRSAVRSPDDNGPPPSLTKPVVQRVWVPDRVEDDKLIRGHYIYIIEKNSVWRDDQP